MEVAEFIDQEKVDAAVAGDGAGEVAFVCCFGELVDQLRSKDVAHGVAAFGGGGAEGDEQVRLAGARVADQAERAALADPVAGGELADQGRVQGGVGGEVELVEPLCAREPGGVETALGASDGAVVALGHDEFGEEPEVGQLFPLRRGGDLTEPRSHRR